MPRIIRFYKTRNAQPLEKSPNPVWARPLLPIPSRIRRPNSPSAVRPPILTPASNHSFLWLRGGARVEDIRIIKTVAEFRRWQQRAVFRGILLALVPTMGALHEGHMRLIEAASQHHEHICVSIYVNPTQFGVSEDLDSYPVTWDNDLALIHALNVKLANLGKGQVSCIFRPSTREIYPGAPPSSEIDADGSFITITPLGRVLEGASRPVFFRGVATIVMKLLNIVQPHTVFFGQKDIQQAVLINRMIKDFHFPTKLGLVATQRLGNQLACSSRNVYLGNRRLSVGTVLIQSLRAALEPIRLNQFSRRAIISAALAKAEDIQNIQRKSPPNERARFEIDYVSLGDPATMDEIQAVDPDRGAVLSAAMTMLPLEDIQPGEDPANNARTVRLIDNILLFPVSALKTMDINQYT